MIVDLKKFLIFGSAGEMDLFFSLAQRAGFLEFLGSSRKKMLELPPTAKTFLSAIKIAKHYPVHPQEVPCISCTAEDLAGKIVSVKAELESLLEEERLLLSEISRISIFGDFSREELNQLENEAKLIFQFFCMKSYLASEITLPPEVVHIGTEYDLDYFLAINKDRMQYPKMIEILIDRPVGFLRERLFFLREEIAKLESDLRSFANAMPDLQAGLIEHLNAYHLDLARHNASLSLGKSLFATEAWVPITRVQSLKGLLSTLDVDCEEIAIEKKDYIPTYIENRGVAKLGEDLLSVFDTPAYTDKDPSTWILIFFSLFFSMIVTDAGYGFVFLVIGLLLRWKFPHLYGIKKRLVKLLLIVSSCTIAWGVATGSYFGIGLTPNNPLQKTSFLAFFVEKKADYHLAMRDDVYAEVVKKYPSVVHAESGKELLLEAYTTSGSVRTYNVFNDFSENILMEFSFLVGILHIGLSFLRYLTRNWPGIGWVMFLIGGYLYFPSIVHATVMVNFMGWISKPFAYTIGFPLVIGGVLLAFLIALVQKGWGVLHEVMQVVQVFGDVLSYLRIYALALGGMVMARTFNDCLGLDLGWVAAIPVILLGHMINISISSMGGLIHGLRLNFLEWFRYSFHGGGRLFNPLRLHVANILKKVK